MKKINIRFSVLLFMILTAGLSRIAVHIPNFTPIGAMALFGGTYFSQRWKAYLLPLMSLFLSDIVIQGIMLRGEYGFPLYDGWYWVYGSFALIVVLGKWILKKVSVRNIILAGIASSLAHWIISDFGVWISGCNVSIYTKDLKGFLLCYYMAIPYLVSFLMGTLFYSIILFGAFEWIKRKYPVMA
jgi:hypothetical protein